MARETLMHMKSGSAIINTGSITGIDGSKELIDYSMTKGGIHAFTRALAANLVQHLIRGADDCSPDLAAARVYNWSLARLSKAFRFGKHIQAFRKAQTQHGVQHGSADLVLATAGASDDYTVEVARCLVLRDRATCTTLHDP
jgi:hypothetical protein